LMTCARAVAFAVFAVAGSAALFLPEFACPLSGGLLRVFGEPGPLALLGSWLIPYLHPPSAASLAICFYLSSSLYLFLSPTIRGPRPGIAASTVPRDAAANNRLRRCLF
jgi:hypothetical protein